MIFWHIFSYLFRYLLLIHECLWSRDWQIAAHRLLAPHQRPNKIKSFIHVAWRHKKRYVTFGIFSPLQTLLYHLTEVNCQWLKLKHTVHTSFYYCSWFVLCVLQCSRSSLYFYLFFLTDLQHHDFSTVTYLTHKIEDKCHVNDGLKS